MTPVWDDMTLVRDDMTPVRDDMTPVRDDMTPVRDDMTPVRDDRTPVRDDRTPVRDDRTPVRDDRTPVWDDVTPVRELHSLIRWCPLITSHFTPFMNKVQQIPGFSKTASWVFNWFLDENWNKVVIYIMIMLRKTPVPTSNICLVYHNTGNPLRKWREQF